MNSKNFLKGFVVLVLTGSCPTLSQQPSQSGLMPPHNRVELPAAKPDESRYWVNNLLVAFDHQASQSKPTITVYDETGASVRSAVVWPKDSVQVITDSVAVSEKGELMASGGAMDDKGAIAYFIARINQSGQIEKLIRTNPFVPKSICAAPDGTIWALGFDRDVDQGRSEEDYALLRQFTFDKGMGEAVLHRSQLRTPSKGYPGSRPNVQCGLSAVYVYAGDDDEWFEYDFTRRKLHKWSLPRADKDGVRITGIALMASGEAYASLRRGSDQSSGLYYLRLANNGTSEWVAVPGTVKPLEKSAVAYILGSRGKDLVYQSDYNERDEKGTQTLSFATLNISTAQ